MTSTTPDIVLKTGDSNRISLCLSGSFSVDTTMPQLPEIPSSSVAVSLKDDGISEWDSSLLVLIQQLRNRCEQNNVSFDFSGLPDGACRLMELASAVPERKGAGRSAKRPPLLTRIGNRTISRHETFVSTLSFLGEAVLGMGRFFVGKARYRRVDFWLIIQQCGPQALGIVTTISVLVGAILAFVGAIQLSMFGAEVYVANLVGLGMVIEMGALMTGIVLAGRTGAAFAAQLGTMQVNEEIDALNTMGIPPMEYLVIPRMVALAVMTPLLVVYADILGILGGAIVGIFALDLTPTVYFSQTFSMMSLNHCMQGLIKGSTFGVLVALCGCMQGINCGRSASAVGEAATSAVVNSLIAIVLADAVWTFIFMVTG